MKTAFSFSFGSAEEFLLFYVFFYSENDFFFYLHFSDCCLPSGLESVRELLPLSELESEIEEESESSPTILELLPLSVNVFAASPRLAIDSFEGSSNSAGDSISFFLGKRLVT